MKHKRRLPLWAAFCTAVLGALGFTLAALAIQPGSLAALLGNFAREPLLLLLNTLPALLLTFLFWALFRNPFYAVSVTGTIVGLLSYVNLVKTGCSSAPRACRCRPS